ncbi:MAG: NAD-dependent DNA ligase LigA [Puniceicoccales bacterium]|jgi:DNA ligase (NAD+)|nr:NAD-dependent DNA ligase LigA [Puniceicoccales bacterium]
MGDGPASGGSFSQSVVEKEFLALEAEIGEHDRRYYGEAAPTISDGAYDALLRRRQELLSLYPDLQKRAAPRTVGDDRLEKFEKRPHRRPMLSLNNTYSEEELRQFIERVERLAGGPLSFAVEPKIDGVAVSLVFRDGHLAHALTRGSGLEGDDVTANVRTIKGLPFKIPEAGQGILEVRGEIYIGREDFALLNGQREEEGLEPFANGRNLAAGSLKVLDPKKAAERRLRFIAYEIGEGDSPFLSHGQVLETLRLWGFPTNEFRMGLGADGVWERIREFGGRRQSYPFDTDGAVVKVDDRPLRERLGSQATAPRWAIAYKFSPERAETVLKGIRLQVGRSGVLTPVAELEPVSLAGTTIRSATLHNADEIARRDLRIGDTVLLERAGEVIPAVLGIVPAKRPPWAETYRYPDRCPACGGNLCRIAGEVAYRCLNPDCPPQIARRLLHFASRSAMDIGSLGPQRVGQLIEAGLVRNFTDIFHLQMDSLLTLPRTGEKSARHLLDGVEGAKNRPLWRLIHGLGIPHVGAETAKALALRWPSLEKLANCGSEELQHCEGIGAIVAASVQKFFQDDRNGRLVAELKMLGLRTEEMAVAGGPLAGKVFAITGTFSAYGREELKQKIEALGGSVRSALSRQVDLLLVGAEPGSKVIEAEKLNIPIGGERDLAELLGLSL